MRARRAVAVAACGWGALLSLTGQSRARVLGLSTKLGRQVMNETYEQLKGIPGRRPIKAKGTAEGVKFFEEGFPDNRILAHVMEHDDQVVVRQGRNLTFYTRQGNRKRLTSEQWVIEEQIGGLYIVAGVGTGQGNQRRLVLEADPSQQSGSFDNIEEELGPEFLVASKKLKLLYSKTDPTKGSLGFGRILGESGLSWLVGLPGDLRFLISKEDPSKYSGFFLEIVEERAPNLVVHPGENGKKQRLISQSDPSRESEPFEKILEQHGPSLLVQATQFQKRFILNADVTNSSSLFDEIVQERGSNVVIRTDRKLYSISTEDPSPKIRLNKTKYFDKHRADAW